MVMSSCGRSDLPLAVQATRLQSGPHITELPHGQFLIRPELRGWRNCIDAKQLVQEIIRAVSCPSPLLVIGRFTMGHTGHGRLPAATYAMSADQ